MVVGRAGRRLLEIRNRRASSREKPRHNKLELAEHGGLLLQVLRRPGAQKRLVRRVGEIASRSTQYLPQE